MGAIGCGWRDRAETDQSVKRFRTPTLATRACSSRAGLLAGASLIALAAFAAPGAALACSGLDQMVTTNVDATLNSNGGMITVTGPGVINGAPDGVDAFQCSLPTLNNSGKIIGANASLGDMFAGLGVNIAEGITVGMLTNEATGTILGGAGTRFAVAGPGVASIGAITTLTNKGMIGGGNITSATGGQGVLNSGQITTLTNTGTISGGNAAGRSGTFGGVGVLNVSEGFIPHATIGTLTNNGTILGGNASGSATQPGRGGAAVQNNATITSLANTGMISGGTGSSSPGGAAGGGGAGVSNFTQSSTSGAIMVLSNQGVIGGGQGGVGGTLGGTGGSGVQNYGKGATIGSIMNAKGATIVGGAGASGLVHGGDGGAGLFNSGMIVGIDNSGSILGGLGGSSAGAGGAGVLNVQGGTISVLTNSGTVGGGEGGRGVDGGVGGAGVSNAGTVALLTNNAGATISGGRGGTGGGFTGVGGAGGAGVSNTGTITTLTNNGTIIAGAGGFGSAAGPAGAGILNTGAGAIGTLFNNGLISGGTYAIYSPAPGSLGSISGPGTTMGSVVVDPAAPFVITGGSGKSFGSYRDGTITVLGGDLTFEGNVDLADNIDVNDGRGTVTNEGVLRLATPVTIACNFEQTSTGVLDFLLGGDTSGEYGALNVTGGVTLDGELALATIGGFHLAGGDTFDLMTFSPDGGGFSGVSLGGVACTATLSTVWDCGGGTGFNLDLIIGTSGVEATILSIPEPSTWALMATGFLSLAGLGLRSRRGASLRT